MEAQNKAEREDTDMAEDKRGKFIVFEGLDGSGKSTQIALLEAKLAALGRKVCRTAEPTDGETGRRIRAALSGDRPCTPAELAAFFLADRIAHNEAPGAGFRRRLDAGEDVLCDRYYYSSFAYQGLETDLKWVADMNRNCPAIAKPDLCVFLDVDYRKCKERLDAGRAKLEIYERDLGFMERTRAQFLKVFEALSGEDRIAVVDADRNVDAVAADVFAVVSEIL